MVSLAASKKLKHGPRTIDAGVPDSLGSGLGHCILPTFFWL